MKLIREIDDARGELRLIRRDIHAHPELGYEEHRTAALVAQKLTEWGYEVHPGLGGTGVVGVLRSGPGGMPSPNARAIGLRADMDALPIKELNTFAHRSTVEGKMHACGHDGHTTMLLGAAQYLARKRPFDGTVVLIFQPAEEGGAGARAMLRDGLFDKFPVDAVFGMHNMPDMVTGTFGVRTGPLMASSNEFYIRITGIGSHAAMPHMGRDPIFTAIQIANALQGVISRNKKPIDAGVLSITRIHAGDAVNVVPNDATMAGTVRTFSTDTLDLIESRMRQIVETVAAAFDCTAEFVFKRNYPPTVNSDAEVMLAAQVMREIVGEAAVDTNVEPTMGAEDFSFMLQQKPGCFAFLGNGQGEHRDAEHGVGPCMLHNPNYDFNDALLPIGSTYWVKLVERFLPATAA